MLTILDDKKKLVVENLSVGDFFVTNSKTTLYKVKQHKKEYRSVICDVIHSTNNIIHDVCQFGTSVTKVRITEVSVIVV